MALTVSVEPGGEIFLEFAKDKLRVWKAEMERAGQRSFSKVVIADTATMYVSSLLMAPGVYKDMIRITAGIAWNFYGTAGVTCRLGKIGQTNMVSVAAGGIVEAVSVYGKSYGLLRDADQRYFVVYPSGAVRRLSNGDYDALDILSGVLFIGNSFIANNSGWGLLLFDEVLNATVVTRDSAVDCGANAADGAYSQLVAVDGGEDTDVTPPGFYLMQYGDSDAEPEGYVRLYGAIEDGLVREHTPLAHAPIRAATQYDFIYAIYGAGPSEDDVITGPTLYSARHGSLGSQSRAATDWVPSAYGDQRAAAIASLSGWYLFEVEKVEDIPATTFATVYFAVTKVGFSFSDSGELVYTVSKVTVTFEAAYLFEITNDSVRLDYFLAVSTASQGYLFFVTESSNSWFPSGDFFCDLRVIDDAGAMLILDSDYPTLQRSFDVLQEAAAGATVSEPYFAMLDDEDGGPEDVINGPRSIRIYGRNGLVYVSPTRAFASVLDGTIRFAGASRDYVFFRVDGVDGEDFLVRHDGETIDLKNPTEDDSFTGIDAGIILSRDTVYSLGTATAPEARVAHVTNGQVVEEVSAPVVLDYAVSGTPSAIVPDRSNVMRFQELAAWQ